MLLVGCLSGCLSLTQVDAQRSALESARLLLTPTSLLFCPLHSLMCWQYQEVDVAWLPIWLPVICAGDAAAGDRRAAQRDGERQATDAGRAAARLAVLYFAQFEVLAVVGGVTLALTHAAQHGGVPTAARQLAAEDTPHATLDAPDTIHADAFFGSQHRGEGADCRLTGAIRMMHQMSLMHSSMLRCRPRHRWTSPHRLLVVTAPMLKAGDYQK